MKKTYLSIAVLAALFVASGARSQTLVISNFMSPNGDGVNDYWQVSDTALTKIYSVKILDSYGQTVFTKASDYNNEFNGRIGSQNLPDGVYYYFFMEGTVVRYNGSITLTR